MSDAPQRCPYCGYNLAGFGCLIPWHSVPSAKLPGVAEIEALYRSAATSPPAPHSSVIYTDLKVRCHDCGDALIWRYLEDTDEIEVLHGCGKQAVTELLVALTWALAENISEENYRKAEALLLKYRPPSTGSVTPSHCNICHEGGSTHE